MPGQPIAVGGRRPAAAGDRALIVENERALLRAGDDATEPAAVELYGTRVVPHVREPRKEAEPPSQRFSHRLVGAAVS